MNEFDLIYNKKEDPWDFENSPYERLKYQHQLDLLPKRQLENVLELGCAEGYFTEKLCKLADHVTAIDISAVALERAEKRLSAFNNVELVQDNIFETRSFPGTYDLIICSETLCYSETTDSLLHVIKLCYDHLKPGGLLLNCHAYINRERPETPGFNWDLPMGGNLIGNEINHFGGLNLLKEYSTSLYRIQLHQKPVKAEPEIVESNDRLILNQGLLDQIKWGSGITEIPILAYHSVSNDHLDLEEGIKWNTSIENFEGHIKALKEHGYEYISLEDWANAIKTKTPLKNKSVCITFDDGYRNFLEAWEILKKYGFGATIFLVSNCIGEVNEWDLKNGVKEKRLLTWDEIHELKSQGVKLGCHTASHTRLTNDLAFNVVRREAEVSKKLIENECGQINAIAYPYSILDSELKVFYEGIGYSIGVTIDKTNSTLFNEKLEIPRFQIGNISVDELIHTIEGTLPKPVEHKTPDVVNSDTMMFLTDKLAVGTREDGTNEQCLVDNGITGILNVAIESPPPIYDVIVGRTLGLYLENIFENTTEILDEAIMYVIKLLSIHPKVLIYCDKHRHRSIAIAIAVIAITQSITIEEAYDSIYNRLTPDEQSMQKKFLDILQDWERSYKDVERE